MKLIKSKKGIALLAILAIAAISAVGAYAYFTTSVPAPARRATGTNVAVVVERRPAVRLYPDPAGPVQAPTFRPGTYVTTRTPAASFTT